jgi:2-polyprenyl-3-methyl-5-hydroxy-6-metoxy-1,4-benzoquinol methylase
MFARRADRSATAPGGASFEQAWAALDPPGSVLDVGAGAGAASLPLLPRTTTLTAVDAEERMLALLAHRAEAAGHHASRVTGRWPDVAPLVPVADVVTCHHVFYNVPDLEPVARALTEHARRRVVVEVSAVHPMTSLNPLWLRFHDLVRPERPTGDDVLAILAAMGLRVEVLRWHSASGQDYGSFAELADVTRRRLCLPPNRTAEVAEALLELGASEEHPADPGMSDREVLTIWWDGEAVG